ncbi:ABC transporter ATP-binding protein [Candidatus Enterococcus murrayae]|uniref:ATP-binding cassette domain-containing protein n=1 Tax=Candidatus Enterococcus murrayae TaxID=2815321 RepID=A0ABS3HK07_9ENTE|nr:ATP-binding cassette domain-containing protein [Enterococcus sp. MJM16]MBO0453269.1 ATP-binding cassette domain-containing protein [Enterococcus sp. MJM16]
MSEIVLKTTRITKSFGGVKVLKDVSIALEGGKIYGFIGLNGAGKTTLMNILMALIKSDSGKVMLFNQSSEKGLCQSRKRIGSMIEAPAIYPEMSAYENINMVRLSRGLPNKELIDRSLEAVGLADTGKKKAKNFSFGMKQRLGIAQALVSEPDILILDEPNNGLDPVSIVELREMLLRINREKKVTMLISSHILEELHQLVTDYIIINEGKIIEAISQKELHERCRRHIAMKVNDPSSAVVMIEKYLATTNYRVMPDHSIKLYDYVDDLNRVLTCLVAHNIEIHSLTIAEESLEDYFVQRVRGDQ